MGDNVLKTPVLIEAQALTDVMGNPMRHEENVQLILQILSSRIRVTTILTKWAVFVSFASFMACMLIAFFTVLTVIVINATHLAFFFEAYFGMGAMVIINTIFLA